MGPPVTDVVVRAATLGRRVRRRRRGRGLHRARALFGVRFTGRREVAPGRHSGMPDWVAAFRDDEDGLASGDLLPNVSDRPFVKVGEGDGGVMS